MNFVPAKRLFTWDYDLFRLGFLMANRSLAETFCMDDFVPTVLTETYGMIQSNTI